MARKKTEEGKPRRKRTTPDWVFSITKEPNAMGHPKSPRSNPVVLSKQQTRAIDFYFGAANFNKSKALRMAGYSPANPSNYVYFFKNPMVAEEVDKRWAEVRNRFQVTYDRVVTEIAKIAFSNILDFGRVDPKTGDYVFDFGGADAAELAAIGEVTVETYTEGKGETAQQVKRMRVKPWNKLTALDQLMRHAGLSKDKTGEAVLDLAARIGAGMKRIGNAGPHEEEED